MKKRSIAWWIFIGWWWYLCFAWWLYPIKRLLFGRKTKATGGDDSYRLMRETENAILEALKNSNNGTALQSDIKNSLSGVMKPYFDEAVHELYQNGKIKTSKDGSRVRLELV